MRLARTCVLLALLAACAKDEMLLVNTLEHNVTLDVRAPMLSLTGGCELPFAERFCQAQYERIGLVDVPPLDERELIISDTINDERCTNVLWLRIVRLDEVGPVEDPGTLMQLPAAAEIKLGAGALHSVAFPQATIRIDELGALDENQAQPPRACP